MPMYQVLTPKYRPLSGETVQIDFVFACGIFAPSPKDAIDIAKQAGVLLPAIGATNVDRLPS